MTYHYTRTPRATHALSLEELASQAPSIMAIDKHASRSEKFIAVPTIDVVKELQRHDFLPVGAKQSRTRDPSRKHYTKHLIRFRHSSTIAPSRETEGVPEIILRNANDGTSSYDLMAGVWREVCLNGLVVCTRGLDSVKVRHNGRKVIEDVIEGTYRVLGQTETYMAAPAHWQGITVSRDAAITYAESAHMLRFDNNETPIKPEQLLTPRRPEDRATDLWTVFNVVQENAIKGGLSAVRASIDSSGRRTTRRVTTRTVNGIDQDVKINQALWQLTERMAQILSPVSVAA